MSSQTLVPFAYIPENSQATPGLWNSVFSTLSQNIALVNSNATLTPPSGNTLTVGSDLSVLGTIAVSGPVRVGLNSNVTNYLFLSDTSNARSNYVIGSQVGGTADGLNIWDDSGQTMIVSFSKQSVRFFQNIVGPVFDTGSGALNVATFGVASDSSASRIQATINAASLSKISRVYVPSSFPYSASSISFIDTVQMVREGGNWFTYDLKAYGAVGDGVTDDSAAIIAAENARNAVPTSGPIVGIPGQIYLVGVGYQGLNTAADAKKLMRIVGDNALWDFSNATIKFGSAITITNGSDNQGLGVVNVQGKNITFRGNVDCNNKAKFGFALQDDKSGFHFDCSIASTITTGGFWSGILPALSVDLKGSAVVNRHINYSGFLRRPFCPVSNNNDSITSYGDITALILGGSNVLGNSVGAALVCGAAATGGADAIFALRTDAIGVPQFLFAADANARLLDFVCHDAGMDVFENAGTTALNSSGYSVPVNTRIGGVFKVTSPNTQPVGCGWWWGNAGTDTSAPNIWIDGGSAISGGRIISSGQIQAAGSSANTPGYAFASELSLGLYLSAASTVALSYGTLSAPQVVGTGATKPQVYALATSGDGRITVEGAASSNQAVVELRTGGALRWDMYNPASSAQLRFYDGNDDQLTLSTSGASSKAGYRSTNDGTALLPVFRFSEESLGWFRSASSTLKLSYGTLDLTASGAVLSVASLRVKSGTNNSCGTAVLGSNGSVNVANTYVAAGDLIFLTDQTPGGTLGDLELGGIRAGSGFTIQSTSITDSSTVGWLIIRPT